ncbi:endo-1,4-beta-xylanase [Paraglaciecola sp.]|uniref:endo-1,4-beta-xylanase n=1 Tax=Paraglaciecola sp. TaxID=1920173 RepID=UPI00273DDCC5|nr:endo-1,4-beta-xylanase [Paraglaciecola sp.]MDP5032614.1 endo-1,4-beta-xylanase [Paraglaciecola sp.]
MKLCYLGCVVWLLLVACGSSGDGNTPTVTAPPPIAPPLTPPPPATVNIPAGGELLISSSEALQPISYLGDAANPVAKLNVVDATHANFNQALKIEVLKPEGDYWNGQILIPLNKAVTKDDVMLVHLYFRTTFTTSESGSGFVTVFMESPAPDYTKYVEREITSDSEWQEYLIPVQIAQDFAKGELQLKFGVGAGNKAQTYEIGGIALYNYGQSVSLESLPKTELSYGGRASDAAWRQAAEERIEAVRKGDFSLTIKDGAGNALTNTNLQINFLRHAYHFGSVVAADMLMQQSSDGDKYRETLLANFNQSGTENDLKWAPWAGEWGESFNQQQTIAALNWLKTNKVYTRGHVLVWPSKRNLPLLVQSYLPEDPSQADPAVKQVVLDHIDDITQATKAYVDEWDVLNEPFDNHYLMDAFGNNVMLDWFNQARLNLPEQALYINDYSILSGGGRNSAHQQHYQDTIEYLKTNNAPITGIGLQSHFSENLTAITAIYDLIERYHRAFPELAIRATEFDVNTADTSLQADFTRDFLTIFFSHPATVGVQAWGFWAGRHWLPKGAMYSQNWQIKPNGEAWQNLIYKTWWNNFSGQTNEAGVFQQRGFYGDYEVSVTVAGVVHTFDFSIGADSNNNLEFVIP